MNLCNSSHGLMSFIITISARLPHFEKILTTESEACQCLNWANCWHISWGRQLVNVFIKNNVFLLPIQCSSSSFLKKNEVVFSKRHSFKPCRKGYTNINLVHRETNFCPCQSSSWSTDANPIAATFVDLKVSITFKIGVPVIGHVTSGDLTGNLYLNSVTCHVMGYCSPTKILPQS